MRSSRLIAVALCVGWSAVAAPAQEQPPLEAESATSGVQTLRPREWDEHQANGVLTSARRVLPDSLSLGRAKRSERAEVEQAELEDRQGRMLEGERFTAKLHSIAQIAAEAQAASDPAPAVRGVESSAERSTTFTWVGVLAALLGLGALAYSRMPRAEGAARRHCSGHDRSVD